MRLFVALDITASARAAIAEAVAEHRHDRQVSWTRPRGWHVTLAFLGEVDDDALDDVVAATATGVAAGGATGPITLTAAAVTVLGRGALAVGLDDDPAGAVADLGAAIQQAVADAGLPVHRRTVAPHLTLARARRRQRVPRGLVEALEVPPVTWTVDEARVVESIVGQGPATYRALAGTPLRSTAR